jgi:outer-membrane receptor for ferric coprogen and ferric-rhodotorulic acid
MQRARSVQPVVRASAVVIAIGAMLMSLAPLTTFAQAAAASTAAARDFDIAPGSLAGALIRFGEQAGVQFTVPASLTAGKQAPALKGRYTPEQGLRELLSGNGLAFRFANPQTVVIEAAPQGDRVLGPVRVEGVQAEAGSGGSGWGVGPNGSSDATATEGSDTFAAAALTVGGKTAHAIKETPQSVSVVTKKQIDEQNIVSIADAMNQTPGVTAQATYSSQPTTFLSRGFTIEKATIDGGAPFDFSMGTSGYSQGGDLAAVYDHVEVLRGGDAIFSGFGAPGGSVNLVRKKPLDHNQVVFDASAGSWQNYRAALDVTGPLTLDGRLRGRLVLAGRDQKQFYDYATDGSRTLYGILEFDATPDTLLTLGGRVERLASKPFVSGIPGGVHGEDLGLPRSTAFVPNWNYSNSNQTEIFAQAEQRFGTDWSAKLNLTHRQDDADYRYASVFGSVDPAVGTSLLRSQGTASKLKEDLADLTVTGKFDAFGRRHELLLGASYSSGNTNGADSYGGNPRSVPINVYQFDPATSYPEPAFSVNAHYDVLTTLRKNVFGKLNLQLTDSLHLVMGVSYLTVDDRTVYTLLPSGYMVEQNAKGSHSSIPFAALTYDLGKSWTAYVSYADGYQQQYSSMLTTGSLADPITGSSYELGVKYQSEDKKVNASLAAYSIRRKGALRYAGNPAGLEPQGLDCCYTQSNQIDKSDGFEAQVSGQVWPGLDLTAGYTYNDNEQTGSDVPTPGVPISSQTPRHMLKLWASYQPQSAGMLKDFSFAAGLNAQSRGFVNDGGGVIWAQGSYAVAGLRVGYRIDPKWSVALNVDNLFDRSYYQTVTSTYFSNWYGAPRNFTLSLRGQF